jgi:hypothetical protein
MSAFPWLEYVVCARTPLGKFIYVVDCWDIAAPEPNLEASRRNSDFRLKDNKTKRYWFFTFDIKRAARMCRSSAFDYQYRVPDHLLDVQFRVFQTGRRLHR